MASFIQRAMYDSYSTGLHQVCSVRAIRESIVTFNKSLRNLHLGFIYHTDVSQHRLMTKITAKNRCKWLPSKGGSAPTWKRDACSLDLNPHSNANSMYLSPLITEWGQQCFQQFFPRWSPAVATCCCLSACVVFYAPPSWMCWLPSQEREMNQ